jgi:hypothetical protein
MQSLLAVPFFGLAWSAGRWPRATGAILLGQGRKEVAGEGTPD